MLEFSAQKNKKEKVKEKGSFFKRYGSLLLSHHPECEAFKDHTLKIGSHHFCIGCFIGYPTAIVGIIIFEIFKIYLILNGITLFLFGLICLLFFILSPLNLTKHKGIKIIQKFFLGLGSAFLFWWIWTLTPDISINFLIFILTFGVILVILNGYHAYSFLKTCKKCKYTADWYSCPGFKKVYKKNKKNY
jgi:hypothetical protein